MAGDKKSSCYQHDASIDEPKPNEIYSVGCIVNIVQSLKLPDGNIKVLVEGVERAKVVSVADDEASSARWCALPGFAWKRPQLDALISRVTGLFEQYVKLSQNLNYETMIAPSGGRSRQARRYRRRQPAAHHRGKQELLEIFDPIDRLPAWRDAGYRNRKSSTWTAHPGPRQAPDGKAQKEYYLNEKIKAIQKELGRGEKSEIDS